MAAASAAAKKPARPAARRPRPAGTRSARNAEALQRARDSHKGTARSAPARRKSGPAARPKVARKVAAPRKPVAPRKAAAPRVAPRPLARVATGGASAVLDGLLRGRGWVVLVGALLAGIVFLNVSVLELNRGIARTDAKASALERGNSRMRERVATLDSAERIQRLAEMRGFVLPRPGDVTYLSPDRKDARAAVTRMQAPMPSPQPTAPPATEPVATPAPTTTEPTPTATPTATPAPAPAPAVQTEPVAATAPAATP